MMQNVQHGRDTACPDNSNVHYMALENLTPEGCFSIPDRHEKPFHVLDLAQSLKSKGGEFEPLLVWQHPQVKKMTVLDGYHRLLAYRSLGWTKPVPVRIFSGKISEALLVYADSKSSPCLPLTTEERLNLAWLLVRQGDIETPTYSKAQVVKHAGCSKGTVDNMRRRIREMAADAQEPSGRWLIDRRKKLSGSFDEATDEAQEAAIQIVTTRVRDALDYRKIGNILCRADDVQIEGLYRAIGEQKFYQMISLLRPDLLDASPAFRSRHWNDDRTF